MNECKQCHRPFETYRTSCNCSMCDDGFYLDSDEDYIRCPFCGGLGDVENDEKEYCKDCLELLNRDDD